MQAPGHQGPLNAQPLTVQTAVSHRLVRTPVPRAGGAPEPLTRIYIPSNYSCLRNPTAASTFQTELDWIPIRISREVLNVSGTPFLEQKGEKVFPWGRRIQVLSCGTWAGHSGDGCLHHSPPPSSGRGWALVVGRETVPLKRVREQHLPQGQGPRSHRQGQAQRCSLTPAIKVNPAQTQTLKPPPQTSPGHAASSAKPGNMGWLPSALLTQHALWARSAGEQMCLRVSSAARPRVRPVQGHNRSVSTRSGPLRGHTQLAFSSQEGFSDACGLITRGPSSSRPQKPSTQSSLL